MPDILTTSSGRLLVADDETRLMTALCNTLRDQGYEVIGVSSGAEALTVLRATWPARVLVNAPSSGDLYSGN
jgi:DNA-binding response OmpR family regulator